jgi:hypothetical protein
MGFLHIATTQIDPTLSSMCRWSNSKCLRIGDTAHPKLRFMSNKRESIVGIHDPSLLTVVLGAGSSEPHFVEMVQALRSTLIGPNTRQIVMW